MQRRADKAAARWWATCSARLGEFTKLVVHNKGVQQQEMLAKEFGKIGPAQALKAEDPDETEELNE